MEYYSTIKKIRKMPFAATWIDLESVTLSEVRPDRERGKCHMASLIRGRILKGANI